MITIPTNTHTAHGFTLVVVPDLIGVVRRSERMATHFLYDIDVRCKRTPLRS